MPIVNSILGQWPSSTSVTMPRSSTVLWAAGGEIPPADPAA